MIPRPENEKQLYHQDWSELYNEPDVHKKAELFQNTMCCIVNEICPPRKICVREDNPKWETDISCKIRRARNRAHQKKSKSYKYLSKLLKKLINKNKKLVIERTVNNLDNNDGRWWNRLSKKRQLLIDGVWYDNKELSEHLNHHFLNVGRNLMNPTCQILISNAIKVSVSV